jgi:hypothetical protein
MAVEFRGSNAVILAPPFPQFNPAAITKTWMIAQLHIAESDLAENSIIQIPLLFTAATRRFQLVVTQERVQLMPTLSWDEGWGKEGDTVRQVTGGVAGAFPGLPFIAIGLNFFWAVYSEGRPSSETSRKLFFGSGNPLFKGFDVPEACFGAYASKDVLGCRLKVEAKPMREYTDEAEPARVLFYFNFHLSLAGDDRLSKIDQLLCRWDEAKAEAARIVRDVDRECGS